ncbi:MAG: tripartite tricarboxylate transporter substrate binding protein [Bdellovibrionales bacterium]|nr:tripartite tricarboxylate transporter substrate binding protein [Massilia sp.]
MATSALSPAFAQLGKTIRIIVPFAAGGPIDLTARVLAERMEGSLGAMIIDNRPGGGGNIGANAVARAAPDGLTIGIASTPTHGVNPSLYDRMPYDAAKDFTPITQILRVPNVVVMSAETSTRLKIRNLSDLIAYGRANPGKLNYGSGGNGSAGHLAGELLKGMTQIDATHIPFNGGNPAQIALLGGQVDFNIDNLAAAAANISSGRLKAIAVTTVQRSSFLPDVPAVADMLPGFEIDTWWGMVGPAGMAPEVVGRLNRAITDALRTPEVVERFGKLYAQPVPSTPEQFAAFMAAERTKYKKIVKASGARAD